MTVSPGCIIVHPQGLLLRITSPALDLLICSFCAQLSLFLVVITFLTAFTNKFTFSSGLPFWCLYRKMGNNKSRAEKSWKIILGSRHISRLCYGAMIRWLLVSLSMRGPSLCPRSTLVEFLVYKWHCDRLFLPLTTSVFPRGHHSTSVTYWFVQMNTPALCYKHRAFVYVPTVFLSTAFCVVCHWKRPVKADSHIPCRSHAVSLPC
jgi:hypothetical protein